MRPEIHARSSSVNAGDGQVGIDGKLPEKVLKVAGGLLASLLAGDGSDEFGTRRPDRERRHLDVGEAVKELLGMRGPRRRVDARVDREVEGRVGVGLEHGGSKGVGLCL